MTENIDDAELCGWRKTKTQIGLDEQIGTRLVTKSVNILALNAFPVLNVLSVRQKVR